MEEIVTLRNEDRVQRVLGDLKFRCKLLDTYFSMLAKKGVIDERCSADHLESWGREWVRGEVSGLKSHLRDLQGNTSGIGAIQMMGVTNILNELDVVIDRYADLYQKDINREKFCLYRYWSRLEASEYIKYSSDETGFVPDIERITERFTVKLDSDQQRAFVAKLREVQLVVASFDKMCKRIGVDGINTTGRNTVLNRDNDGNWWVDFRPLADVYISEKDVEMIDTSSLDNVREASRLL